MRKWSIAAAVVGAIGIGAWIARQFRRPRTAAEAAIMRSVRTMNEQEREVFLEWIAIPDPADSSVHLVDLQMRYGKGLVRRASERFESVRTGLGISRDDLLEAARRILNVEPLP